MFYHVIPTTLLYYRGLLLRATFVLLLIFAGLIFLTESSCLQEKKIEIKDPGKIEGSVVGRTDEVKSQFIVFFFPPEP